MSSQSDERAPRRVRVYIEPADWWIGYYRGPNHHYVCPVPLVVICWPRRSTAAEEPRPPTFREMEQMNRRDRHDP